GVKKKDAVAMVLDGAQSYRLFTGAGYCARVLADPKADPSSELFKLYWNDIRMGGRDPGEVGRSIALADCLESLGLAGAAEDAAAVRALKLFEKKAAVELPRSLKALWSKAGALGALREAHPNNPEPIAPGEWALVRDAEKDWDGDLAVKIMDPHQ